MRLLRNPRNSKSDRKGGLLPRQNIESELKRLRMESKRLRNFMRATDRYAAEEDG